MFSQPRRMSRRHFLLSTLVPAAAFALSARGAVAQTPAPAAAPTPAIAVPPTATLDPTAPTPTPLPPTPAPASDPLGQAILYFNAWQGRRYQEMYGMLSREARAAIDEERFVRRYAAIAREATIQSVTIVPGSPSAPRDLPPDAPPQALVPFTIEMKTVRVGDLREENVLPLVFEDGAWRVQWSPSLIFRDLSGDNLIRMFPDDPLRGSIVDRHGNLLATQVPALELGLIPGEIEDEKAVLAALSEFLALEPDVIKAKYASAQPDWWIPLRELPMSRQAEVTARLGHLKGVELREKPSRGYPHGSLLQHVLGYVTRFSAEDVEEWAPKGYGENDWIGRAGLERWGEQYLAGGRGGTLAVVTPEEKIVKVIAENPARLGYNLRLTIDIDIQRAAEEALGERAGSVVVLDLRENGILAIASHPTFDPNHFITGWSEEEWKQVSEDPRQPFLFRAVLSAYPTGSIFKAITMAAALERTDLRPTSTFNCGGVWYGLGGNIVLSDWLPGGHGTLNFVNGLTQSCNIVFYEASKRLDSVDPNILPEFARAYGLGAETGVVGLPEATGTVPDPEWKQRVFGQPWFPGDSVNLGIGQGFLEATPLQMANAYAAIATGQLRTPIIVREIVDARGTPVETFAAQERHPLPVAPENLEAVREGMKRVPVSGTASGAFRGSPVADRVAAKTGAAENQDPNTHAWFASFGPHDDPQYVVVVMIEKGGFGGQVAAPIARKIWEALLIPPEPVVIDPTPPPAEGQQGPTAG